ncbi:MAG: toprim domain-containing protein [Bacteroidaceae bacterium]|nr:toprim domain-containing protein [Bacteroidaceae bacterium]
MNEYEYNSLRQRAIDKDMTKVCRDLGIELGTRGKWRECRCPNPQHEDCHPSCKVNVKKNRFKCFSCGCGGNNIDLVRLVRGCSYMDAVAWLLGTHALLLTNTTRPAVVPEKKEETEQLDIKWLHLLVSPREYYSCLSQWAKDFLNERRIDPNLIDAKGIVSIDQPVATQRGKRISSQGNPYTPKFSAPALLFPYRDENDILINLQARLQHPAEGQQRFHFPPGSRTSLWNPRDALTLPDGADLWLCEGVSDALALLTSGRPALALASATSLTPEAADFIARQANRLRLHIYPDNDDPGRELYNRLLKLCPALRRHELPEGFKDFGQAWAAGAIDKNC